MWIQSLLRRCWYYHRVTFHAVLTRLGAVESLGQKTSRAKKVFNSSTTSKSIIIDYFQRQRSTKLSILMLNSNTSYSTKLYTVHTRIRLAARFLPRTCTAPSRADQKSKLMKNHSGDTVISTTTQDQLNSHAQRQEKWRMFRYLGFWNIRESFPA
jgi:hypothetical protein